MLKYLLTTLCCLTLLGSEEIFGQALETRVNVIAKNLTIKEILQQIESSTSIRFSYSDDVVPVEKRINLNLRNVRLKQALNQIFANTFIDFRENQNQILLFRKKLNLNKDVTYTISGFIREAQSGEPLMGVNIARKGTWEGTSTNAYGHYSLTSSSDTFHLQISYIGFKTVEQFILLDQNIELNVLMEDNSSLGEIVVGASKTTAPEEITTISKIEIPIPQIQEIPALFGEKDVFKAIKLMPGIQSGNEGQSGFYVRGGGPDQNLIILDDATVYNAFHLFGFFSLFNGDALRSVELTKGGFPARYGGRLSSVLDVHMKDGN
ncbi:MAG: carboxypeptidase-like regulatory domain-containing protein, partial [Bacteroidia bacterium]